MTGELRYVVDLPNGKRVAVHSDCKHGHHELCQPLALGVRYECECACHERAIAKQAAEDVRIGRALMLMMAALVIFAATMAFVTQDHAKPAWHEQPVAEVRRAR